MQTDNFSNVDKTKIFSEISGNFKEETEQINFIKYVFSAAAAELWFRLLLTADWLIALNNKPGKIQITNYNCIEPADVITAALENEEKIEPESILTPLQVLT